MSEVRYVPKLRFKGFSDDWKTNKLKEIFIVSAGGDIKKENVCKVKSKTFRYPIYANSEKRNGLYGYSNTFKIDYECVTVSGRGSLGNAVPRFNKFYPIVRLLILKPINYQSVMFFSHVINLLNIYNESTGVPQLTAPQLKTYKVKYPSISEQQKIASFLASVDKKIEQLQQKKSLLEQYKKGVMQKIFNQDLRFKDDNGNNYPDWEENKLKNLCLLITKGTTPTSLGFNFIKHGVNFIKAENISNSYFIDIESTHKISDECNITLKRSILKTNDLLFSIAGTLGRTAIVSKKDLPANTNQALAIIRLKEDIHVSFINFVLNSITIRKRIAQLLSVGAQPNLSLEQIGKFNIPFPLLEEQTKIANFLSAIDAKIELVNTQLKNTQQFKKGLLQQMFV